MEVAADSIVWVMESSLEGSIFLFYTVFVYLLSDHFIHTYSIV